eukprot:jgi/Tetstr1/451621/TSEL_038657.t1
MIILVFLGSLFGTLAIGLPVAFALLTTGIVLMSYMGIFNPQIIAQQMITGANTFTLLAIPFFLLAGELMNAGGLSRRIVHFAVTCVGHIRGGLGFVAVMAAVIMASMSGSAAADSAALAAILVPMMRDAGYNVPRAAGLMASGGIVAPVVALPKSSGGERLKAAGAAVWALFMPVIILAGIRFGVFTPTEAAVVAAVYALFVGGVVYRELTWASLYRVFVNAAKTTSIVMFLVAAALVTSWLITSANIPNQLVGLVQPFIDNPKLLMLFLIVLLLLVVGMVLDLAPTILIFGPVLMPMIRAAEIDPVYFGIMFVMTTCISLITPPVGVVLNVVSGVSRVPMGKVVYGVLPFILSQIIVLALLVMFPEIVLTPLNWLR